MTKNFKIIDYQPKNESILDWKPKNKIEEEGLTDQLYAITLRAGAPMGLLLTLTYPTNINITSPKSP